jgi:quinol monooxygenase YgiN
MVHVLVRHKVSDYNRWKQAFDSHLNTRKHGGETGFRIFHTVDDPREVVLFLDWENIEQARKFMNSDELRKAMQLAGVEGAPDVQYIEDVRTVHRSSAD